MVNNEGVYLALAGQVINHGVVMPDWLLVRNILCPLAQTCCVEHFFYSLTTSHRRFCWGTIALSLTLSPPGRSVGHCPSLSPVPPYAHTLVLADHPLEATVPALITASVLPHKHQMCCIYVSGFKVIFYHSVRCGGSCRL